MMMMMMMMMMMILISDTGQHSIHIGRAGDCQAKGNRRKTLEKYIIVLLSRAELISKRSKRGIYSVFIVHRNQTGGGLIGFPSSRACAQGARVYFWSNCVSGG